MEGDESAGPAGFFAELPADPRLRSDDLLPTFQPLSRDTTVSGYLEQVRREGGLELLTDGDMSSLQGAQDQQPNALSVSPARVWRESEFEHLGPGATLCAEPINGANRPHQPPKSGNEAIPNSSTSTTRVSSKRKASPPDTLLPEDVVDEGAATKRQRNTIAARRYRQKWRDRITELESMLGNVVEERDGLKLKLARKEAEVDALREMLSK
ncbi:hypothetical protein CTRI78_v006295 [Colletotrichum trifolii]|uniref:BZIP domain-containing protein n=1 Tax=Colletotrichum trifolii TaxID=5466 RepID=A0A4R8RCS0_COLTR|nr:hypothetical protein CTRI78_v006295 [Colletotrichum trifolii]